VKANSEVVGGTGRGGSRRGGEAISAAGRTGSSPRDRSTVAHTGGRRPTVMCCVSHRGVWRAGHRGTQPRCPARGGGSKPTRGQRRPVDAEEASRWSERL
jgi:hypothetical protein